MNGGPNDLTGRLDAPPWEAFGRFLDGHGGLSDSRSLGEALACQRQGYGGRSSPTMASSTKSGLTRRGVIYEYIRAHPGSYVRGMARELRLGTGDLHYHLFWLEKNGFVKTKKSGFYRYVFPTRVFREEQEVLLQRIETLEARLAQRGRSPQNRTDTGPTSSS